MANDFISLNVGEDNIKIADTKLSNNLIEITSLCFQTDTPLFYSSETEKTLEQEAKIIESLITNSKIKKKNVNIIIPDGYTFSQIIEMPHLKEKELLSAIKYQADQFIPMPLEETALDLEIIQEDNINKKLMVMIVAAPQKLINRLTSLAELSGLIPEVVENEISTTARLISELFKNLKGDTNIVFLNLGYSTSSLYYYCQKRNLILESHSFKLGYELFLKDTQMNTNLDIKKTKDILKTIGINKDASLDLEMILKPVTEELTKEIEKFIILIKEKYKLNQIDQIYLINQAENLNLIDKKIEATVNIPTSSFDLLPYVKKNQIVNSFPHGFSSFVSVIGGSID